MSQQHQPTLSKQGISRALKQMGHFSPVTPLLWLLLFVFHHQREQHYSGNLGDPGSSFHTKACLLLFRKK
jgi:hypothetical protein